jgi:Nucleolar and spindle-associated protein
LLFSFKAPPGTTEKKKAERPKTDLKALTKKKANTTPKAAASRSAAKAPVPAVRTPANKALLNITNRSLIGGGTPSSAAKKPVFDLKASLAKPLGYKPHTGKLQDWGKKVRRKALRAALAHSLISWSTVLWIRKLLFGFRSTKFFFGYGFGFGFCRRIFWKKPFQSFLSGLRTFLNTILRRKNF